MMKLIDILNELDFPLAKGKDLQAYAGQENWKGKLVWMTPDKFLSLANPLDPSHVNKASIEKLRKRILAGQPVDFLVLEVDMENNTVNAHEGRHRAMVAKELGIEKVPVLIFTGSGFKRVPQWTPEDHARVDKAEFLPEWSKKLRRVIDEMRFFKKKMKGFDKEDPEYLQCQKELDRLYAEQKYWEGLYSEVR